MDDWVRFYSLKKNQQASYFFMAASMDDILALLRNLEPPDKVQYALSVQAGASLVAPYSSFREVHVYAKGAKDIEHLD
ncbi:MAG: hypothetical protein ACOWWM_19200 [Desulfobacterales bacterium]